MGLWMPHEMNEAEPTIGLGEGPLASWLIVAGAENPKCTRVGGALKQHPAQGAMGVFL